MKDVFKAIEVTDKVYWVGAIDWPVRNFHGYATHLGTTYNAFLILADKITLVDTVRAPFKDEMLARCSSIVDLEKIDYIISNHAEPDHSGCLVEAIEKIKPEKVFASVMGVNALKAHYHITDQLTPIEDGQTLSLGDLNVSFLETRMVHWPDSMFSYLHEEQLLFSQDGFGMHLATYERFDDEINPVTLEHEAAKYFANILMPLSNFIIKTLDKISGLGWKFSIIAPDHGPIWRKDINGIIEKYARWAKQHRGNKAVVLYDTMWSSTELMARAIGEGLASGGTNTKLMPMGGSHRSDIATELLDAGALIVGAPTINNEIFPTLADALYYIKGLRPKNLIGTTFGSFGWGGQAPKNLRAMLEEMGVEIAVEPLRIKYVPDAASLKKCYDLGAAMSKKLSG